MITEALIEAALRLVNAPEGGRVHTARVDKESLSLLVDYGIGGIKKWVVPLSKIHQPASAASPDSSKAEKAKLVKQRPKRTQPEPAKPTTERKRQDQQDDTEAGLSRLEEGEHGNNESE